jgi:predicted PurR-regulated permease PerM
MSEEQPAPQSPDNQTQDSTTPAEELAPTQTSATNSGSHRLTPTIPQTKLSRYVSFALLLAIIILLGIIFYEVMAKFIVPLFLSALLVCIFRPLHRWILKKVRGREALAAGLTTASVLLAVLVPLGLLFTLAAAEGRHALRNFNSAEIIEGVRKIRTNLKLDMPSAHSLRLIEMELGSLQNGHQLDANAENRNRIALFEVEDAAKQLAVELKLDWPERAAEEKEWSEQTDWEKFVLKLSDSRELFKKMSWSSGESEEEKRQSHDELHNYQAQINETANYYSDFRDNLLGGRTKAWVTELVNPNDSDSEAYASTVVNYLRDKLFTIGGRSVAFIGNLLFGTAIMIIGLYFFLLDGPKMIESFKGLSPIDDAHEQELVSEFGRVSRAVVVATLLSALVQGLLAGIGFYFVGMESVFLLTVLSAVLAMVPFVGAAAVWVPCALYLYFMQNNLPGAICLAVYGVAIISMADNVIKPYILHGQSNLHPLLALLSVIGGVAVLGPIGILIGPMVVAFLQTLLKILQREMREIEVMTTTEDATAQNTSSA